MTVHGEARVFDAGQEWIGIDEDAPADLLVLEAELWTGVRLAGNAAVPASAAELSTLREQYEAAAKTHAAQCKYPAQNRWMHEHAHKE